MLFSSLIPNQVKLKKKSLKISDILRGWGVVKKLSKYLVESLLFFLAGAEAGKNNPDPQPKNGLTWYSG